MKGIPITLIVLFLVVAQNKILSTETEEPCLAKTRYGQLLGKHMISHSGKVFMAFLGIPYAAPPVGELRFLPPVSPTAWKGTRNSTVEKNICLQRKRGGLEDCLYLNVFTPSVQSNVSSTVMVFIHGGGYIIGSASLEKYGPENLMDRDIVLVTLQYRLGAFGFLSTEDEVIPGNMGMKDQVRALQWVQDNIQAFGGDASKVTIFGESAGGSSVHLHMSSPLSRHLFARGISQSGTAFSGFSLASKGDCKNTTAYIASSLNCSTLTSIEILHCLQNKNANDVLEAYNNIINLRYEKILLRPVIEPIGENSFLPTNPRKEITDKPWLVGVNANEAIYKVPNNKLNETFSIISTDFHTYSDQLIIFQDMNITEKLENSTYDFYFKDALSTEDKIRSLERLISDSWFVWPTVQAIQHHNNTHYIYLYDHEGEHSYSEVFGGPRGFGVSHMDELYLLFTNKPKIPSLNVEDSTISKQLVDFWVNFAIEGNPTPSAINSDPQTKTLNNFFWEASSPSTQKYLHIQTNNLSMKTCLYCERMEFWRQLTTTYGSNL